MTQLLPLSLPQLPDGRKYWVALSGGLDSSVLLHRVCTFAEINIAVVHVDHGLQPESKDWSERCRSTCENLGIEFHLLQIRVDSIGDMGLEAAARQARYDAIARLLSPGDVLLTAHHQDDQAETLLLQLLRGAGPHGLSAMSVDSEFGSGRHIRPLLHFKRADILEYAERNGLSWIDDPSNSDLKHRRNYLRQKVLPLLGNEWPEYSRCFERVTGLQAEASYLLDDLALLDLRVCRGNYAESISICALKALSPHRRRNVIRYWLRSLDYPVPSQAQMRHIEVDVLDVGNDANPLVGWSDVEIRRYRNDMFAMHKLPAAPDSLSMSWDLRQKLILPEGCGWLEAECAQGAGIRLETPGLELRFNQPGERIQPVFSNHHKRLKHLFQENGVPPWVRGRLPLIYHGQSLAAVADRWIASGYAARRNEQGWQIHWRDAPVGWFAPESLPES